MKNLLLRASSVFLMGCLILEPGSVFAFSVARESNQARRSMGNSLYEQNALNVVALSGLHPFSQSVLLSVVLQTARVAGLVRLRALASNARLGSVYDTADPRNRWSWNQIERYATQLAELQGKEFQLENPDIPHFRNEFRKFLFLPWALTTRLFILVSPEDSIVGYATVKQSGQDVELLSVATEHATVKGRGDYLLKTILAPWASKPIRLIVESLMTAAVFYHREFSGKVDYLTRGGLRFEVFMQTYNRLTEDQKNDQQVQQELFRRRREDVSRRLAQLPAGSYRLAQGKSPSLMFERNANGEWESEALLVSALVYVPTAELRSLPSEECVIRASGIPDASRVTNASRVLPLLDEGMAISGEKGTLMPAPTRSRILNSAA